MSAGGGTGSSDGARRDGAAPVRCAVLGDAGGGKSTLARRLAERCGAPCVELDRFPWHDGWRPVPTAESDAAIAEVVATGAWVVDGTGRPTAVAARLGGCFEMMWHVETRWMPRVRILVGDAERAWLPVVRIADLDAPTAAQDGGSSLS